MRPGVSARKYREEAAEERAPGGVGRIWLGRAWSGTFQSEALWVRDFCAKLFSRKHSGLLKERQKSVESCPDSLKQSLS